MPQLTRQQSTRCMRSHSGLIGAALPCRSESAPRFRPALRRGHCRAVFRLGLVDATPRAPPRQATTSIESRAQLPGLCRADAPLPLPGRPSIKGLVAATPAWSDASFVSKACGLRLQVVRFVVTTPRPTATALAKSAKVGRSPVSLPCVDYCRVVSGSLTQLAGRNSAVALLKHWYTHGGMRRPLDFVQGREAQTECPEPSAQQTDNMSGGALSVTQHLQALRDMAAAPGSKPTDDEAAVLFASLDQAWINTHRGKLTAPTFEMHFKTFLLIRRGIAPSSPDARVITELVQTVGRLRIRLLVERGCDFGVARADGEQQCPGLRMAPNMEEALSLPAGGGSSLLPPLRCYWERLVQAGQPGSAHL